MTTYLAAIDPGNQNVDLVFGELGKPKSTHKTFHSLVSSYADEFTFSRTDVDGSGDREVRRFGVGDYPEAEWVKDSEGKPQWVLPLLVYGMWSSLKDGDRIVAYASAHNTGGFKDAIKEALNGSYEFISEDGEQKTIHVSCDAVMIEGIGAMLQSKPETKNNALIDLGGGTVLLTPYTGTKLAQGCKEPYQLPYSGTASLIAEITKLGPISKALGRCLTYREARSVLDDPKHKFNGHDFSEVVGEEIERWVSNVVKNIENLAKAHLQDVTKIATGGACAIPEVRNWLKAYGYTIVKDPLNGHVKGMYQFAQSREAKKNG